MFSILRRGLRLEGGDPLSLTSYFFWIPYFMAFWFYCRRQAKPPLGHHLTRFTRNR